jgi:hypothetical protein
MNEYLKDALKCSIFDYLSQFNQIVQVISDKRIQSKIERFMND